MRKTIYRCILITILIGISANTLFADDTTNNQNITFDQKTPGGPRRAPSLYPVSFSGSFFMDELIINAVNYTGNITVQITGINGNITQTVPISESENAVIDINSLPEGEYDINIITDGKGIFTGSFEM